MSKNKPEVSLRYAVVGLAATLMLAMLAFNLFYIVPRQQAWLEDTARATAQQTLQQVGAVILGPLLRRDLTLVHETLDSQLQANSAWTRIRLLDAGGVQVFPLTLWDDELGEAETRVEVDLVGMEGAAGQLRLILDLGETLKSGRLLAMQLAGFELGLLLLTLALVFTFINRSIVLPLETLSAAFRAITRGDFDAPLPPSPHQEIAAIMRDFTETRSAIQRYQENLVQLRIEAESFSLAKTRFMSRMSHELRTPLTSILGFSELLLARRDLAAQAREQLDAMKTSGTHLLNLIDDILDFSTQEVDEQHLELVPVNVNELFARCRIGNLTLAMQHGITLEFRDPQPATLAVQADARRLLYVLGNLVSNAIKYNCPHGSVQVAAEQLEDGRICLLVSDTGQGLDADEQQRIFQPFERLERHSRQHDGTGIGLSLCRRLVARMQGQLLVASQPGQGAEFRVFLPVARLEALPANAQAAPTAAAPPEPNPGITSLSILVAEDNAVNRMVIREQLTQLGHHCVLAEDGLQAWSLLQQQKFDLLLTDIMMPVMDGLELTRRIRASEQGGEVRLPICALSAAAALQDQALAQDAGVDAYVTKPVTLAGLQQALQSLVAASGIERSAAP